MPKALRDHLGMDAGAQRQGGVRVPKIVEPDLGQPRAFQRLTEVTRDDLRVPGRAVLLCEDEATVSPLIAFLCLVIKLLRGLALERLDSLGIERHRAATPGCLWLPDDYRGAAGGEGSSHREPPL